MVARLVALIAALAAAIIGYHIYRYSGGVDSPGLRNGLVLLAACTFICIVALRMARKKGRSRPPR